LTGTIVVAVFVANVAARTGAFFELVAHNLPGIPKRGRHWPDFWNSG